MPFGIGVSCHDMLTPLKRSAMSHDASYKLLFSHAEMAAELQNGIRGITIQHTTHAQVEGERALED